MLVDAARQDAPATVQLDAFVFVPVFTVLGEECGFARRGMAVVLVVSGGQVGSVVGGSAALSSTWIIFVRCKRGRLFGGSVCWVERVLVGLDRWV